MRRCITGGPAEASWMRCGNSIACGCAATQCTQSSTHLEIELLVDLKGLLEHLIPDGDLADRRAVKVVQAVNVVLHPRLV